MGGSLREHPWSMVNPWSMGDAAQVGNSFFQQPEPAVTQPRWETVFSSRRNADHSVMQPSWDVGQPVTQTSP